MKISAQLSGFWNTHITTIAFIIMLVVFMGSSTFFALRLKPAIIPDEPTHFIQSQQFSTSWGIPPDVPATYAFGSMSHKPYLYYWINGRALNVLNFAIPAASSWRQLVFLRLLSMMYSVLTIVFCYLLAKEIIGNRWWQLLVVFLLTNTLMFVFLSGGVNYDNLTNLCSFASIYFLVRVFNNKAFYPNSLGWLVCICIGTLVKITVLPLLAATAIVWIIFVLKNRHLIDFKPSWNWKLVGLATAFVGLVVLNLALWGVNLATYRALKPPCTQVMTTEECNLSPFVARAQHLNLPEKLSWGEVLFGDHLEPVTYVFDYWTEAMLKRIYGIMGHQLYFPNLIITFYRLLILWAVLIMIKYGEKPSFVIGSLLAVFILYTLVLLQTNYNSEMITGFKHVAVQGRYIFPVIGIAYTLMVYSLSKIPNTIVRRLTVAFALALFTWGGPIVFLSQWATTFSSWFN